MIDASAAPSPEGTVHCNDDDQYQGWCALPESLEPQAEAMHVYVGVDCKQCRKFIAFREIAPGADNDTPTGNHQLRCANGHQSTYVPGDFYSLESSASYEPNSPIRRTGAWEKFGPPDSGRELRVAALVLAFAVVLAWRFF